MSDSEVQLGFNTGAGPDGKIWGVILIANPPLTFQFAVPPDAIESVATMFAAQIVELAAAVKRANLGLVLPTNKPSFDPSILNGKGN